MYRQGDVLLDEVRQIPAGARRLASRVLAQGKLGGHAHILSGSRFQLLAADEQLYVDVTVAAELTHPEHGGIEVRPGLYRVVRQREYKPQRPSLVVD